MRYIVQFDYHSDAATWQAGAIVDLPEDEAAWFNRDAKGVLKPIVDMPAPVVAQVVERIVAKATHDRMVRKAKARTNDPNAMITRETFKAVRDRT